MRKTIFSRDDIRKLETSVNQCIISIQQVSKDKAEYDLSLKEAVEFILKSLTAEFDTNR